MSPTTTHVMDLSVGTLQVVASPAVERRIVSTVSTKKRSASPGVFQIMCTAPAMATTTMGVIAINVRSPWLGGISVRKQLGVAPANNTDTTTKSYVDSGVLTMTNKTLTAPAINGYTEGINAMGTVGSAATLSIANATIVTATLTSATACTFTMPTAAAGKSFVLLLKQPASGTATTATFTGVKWSAAGAPTITATLGKLDILTFVSDGTNWYGSYAQGYTY